VSRDNKKCPRSRAWLGFCPDPCWASSFVERGTGERGKERTLVYQEVSQYTPSRYVPIELLHLFTQNISLDISQRSIFLSPLAFSTNLFQIGGHFLFSWYFVPNGSSNPENPCGCRRERDERGEERGGHELFSLDIVGNSKWDDRFPAVGLRKGAGERNDHWAHNQTKFCGFLSWFN